MLFLFLLLLLTSSIKGVKYVARKSFLPSFIACIAEGYKKRKKKLKRDFGTKHLFDSKKKQLFVYKNNKKKIFLSSIKFTFDVIKFHRDY